MRARHIAALVLLLLPSVAQAQRRFPWWFGRGRDEGREMPPVPGQISRDLSYHRLRYSVESYPFITTIQAPGFAAPGIRSQWTSLGVGEHLSWRLSQWSSVAADVTSAQIGGLAATESIELGTRIGPERWNHRVHPFIDARIGYMRAFEGYFGSPSIVVTSAGAQEMRYGQGFGGVVGFGVERSLTNTLSLTTAFAYARNRLDSRSFNPGTTDNERYTMNAQRYIIALRWNPVRYLGRPTSTPSGH